MQLQKKAEMIRRKQTTSKVYPHVFRDFKLEKR